MVASTLRLGEASRPLDAGVPPSRWLVSEGDVPASARHTRFNRRHHEVLAAWLASTDLQGRRALVESLGQMLALDNPKVFDRLRWQEACGVVIVHRHKNINAPGGLCGK